MNQMTRIGSFGSFMKPSESTASEWMALEDLVYDVSKGAGMYSQVDVIDIGFREKLINAAEYEFWIDMMRRQ